MATLVSDTTFTGKANTVASANPGGVGNGFIDIVGNAWNINNNFLVSVANYGAFNTKQALSRGTGVNGTTAQAENPADALIFAKVRANNNARSGQLYLRHDGSAANANAYALNFNLANASISVDKYVAGVKTTISATASFSVPVPSATNQYDYWVCFRVKGTTLSWDVRSATTPNTIITGSSGSVVDASLATGQIAVGPNDPAQTTQITTYNFADGVVPTFGSGLTSPGLILLQSGGSNPGIPTIKQTSVSFSGTAATSNNPPVTHSMLTSTALGTAPASMTNAGAAAPSVAAPTLTGLTPDTYYQVCMQAVDSFAPAATTYSPVLLFKTRKNADLFIGFGGTSILANRFPYGGARGNAAVQTPSVGTTLAEAIARQISAMRDCYVGVRNGATAGTNSQQWKPASGQNLVENLVTNYNADVTAAGYTGLKIYVLEGNLNDSTASISAATYQTNVQATVNYLLGTGAADYVFLMDPPIPGDGANVGTWSYLNTKLFAVDQPAALDAIASATAKVKRVKWQASETQTIGGQSSDNTSTAQGAGSNDGAHPNGWGAEEAAGRIASSIINGLYPVATGGGGLLFC